MAPWPFRTSSSNHSVQVKRWADGVVPEGQQRGHYQQKGTPATDTSSTAVGDALPAPAIQSDRYSITSHKRRGSKRIRFDRLQSFWEGFKERIGTGTAPSSSTFGDDATADRSYTYHDKRTAPDEEPEDDELDEVVVDRIWSDEYHSTISHLSEHGQSSPEKSGHPDLSSVAQDELTPRSPLQTLKRMQEVTVAIFMAVFSSRFVDDKKERHYQQEEWFVKKPLALVTSLWWIVNWILGVVFVHKTDKSLAIGDYVYYFGVAPVLSLPVVLFVMFDFPRDRQYLYQIWLILSIWCWPFYHVIYINVCGLYRPGEEDCHGRDFLPIFYYATALQTIAFFGLKLNRLPAAIGALAYILLTGITIIPQRQTWIRSIINMIIFHGFLIYVHYMREQSERRLYTLRDQLKMQYKATQRAQLNERKASDSKRRLTSYVFHEVRVPLNTALLAVQNMAASGTVAKNQEIEFNALSGSLSMMSKVLNDVLDFNRMDMGKFESASRPYQFHQVMRSLFIPLRLATDSRGLDFETHLDPNIDKVARGLAYEALGETPETIRQHLKSSPDLEGVVVGDEARLRQIVTNLASNACKFTPPGGKMTITTKLIRPFFAESDDPLDWIFPPGQSDSPPGETNDLEAQVSPSNPLSAEMLSQHNFNTRGDKGPPEAIVVRIEISDTGYGIRPKEMASHKLFSAFNQTEQGVQQGGKGTGLGLALVRQIVKLTGGRLGLRSKLGEGSTFWVELPLGVGRKTFTAGNASRHETSSRPSNTSGGGPSKQHHLGLFETKNNEVVVARTNALTSLKLRPDGSVHREPLPPIYNASNGSDYANLLVRSASMSKSAKTKQSIQDDIVMEDIRSAIPCSPSQEVDSDHARSESKDATAKHEEEDAKSLRPKHVDMPSRPNFAEHPAVNENPFANTPSTNSTLSSSSMSPLAAYDTTIAHSGSASSSSPSINVVPGLNVLVVDDDQLTRMLMTRILTRIGCKVTTAENGEAAIDLILGSKGWAGVTPNSNDSSSKQSGPILEQPRRNPDDLSGLGPVPQEIKYAVVFLDNQMPIMSGLRAVERLRHLGRQDFVVGVTGNALLTDQQEYLDAGADKVLTKPVLERSLREALVAAEERRKSRSKMNQLTTRLVEAQQQQDSLNKVYPKAQGEPLKATSPESPSDDTSNTPTNATQRF